MIEKWLTPAKRSVGNYPPIKKVFARETEKMLFDDRGRKTLKRNDYQIYHDTEQQAIKHMAMLFSQEKARSDSQRIKESAPALLQALDGIMAIVNDSRGVAGFHLNGNTALWEEFEEIDAALAAIAEARGTV